MPHRGPANPKLANSKMAGRSPSKNTTAKTLANGTRGTPKKQKAKRKPTKTVVAPLFAFDADKEGYDWGRPKRRIKVIARFDPTTKETQSDCRIGEGFMCPQCSAVCSYDSRQCYRCNLECCYEAGVGVVVLQDRQASYNPRPVKKKAKKDKKANTTVGGVLTSGKGEPLQRALRDNCINDDTHRERKNNIFSDLKLKLKAATTKTNPESPLAKDDKSVADRVEEATREWAESTIAASKEGAYSTASSNPPMHEDDPLVPEVAALPTEPPFLEDGINCCQVLKQQLISLQLKYDPMLADANEAEEEFRGIITKLEANIVQRNKDAAAFLASLASASSRIVEIKKMVHSLTTERDEFVKTVEAKGLSSVPKHIPNYSTRIDLLQHKMLKVSSECDDAKVRVRDLMIGTEVATQEEERATKDQEIDSLTQQLSEATTKISTMAAEKAGLVESVASTLIYVSGVRRAAEAQMQKISEYEALIEALKAQREAAGEESKKEILRLEAEREEAVAKAASLEVTVCDLRSKIKILSLKQGTGPKC